MYFSPTYAIGAIILPNNRLVLSMEGSTKSNISLSLETFIPKINLKLDTENFLIDEVNYTLGLNLSDTCMVDKLVESSVKVRTKHSHRDLKFYVYKLKKCHTFKISSKNYYSLMFLSIDQINKQILNKELNLSFYANHMLRYLSQCKIMN